MNTENKNKFSAKGLRTLLQAAVFSAAAAILATVTDWWEVAGAESVYLPFGAAFLSLVQNWLEDRRAA